LDTEDHREWFSWFKLTPLERLKAFNSLQKYKLDFDVIKGQYISTRHIQQSNDTIIILSDDEDGYDLIEQERAIRSPSAIFLPQESLSKEIDVTSRPAVSIVKAEPQSISGSRNMEGQAAKRIKLEETNKVKNEALTDEQLAKLRAEALEAKEELEEARRLRGVRKRYHLLTQQIAAAEALRRGD
jgi:hypothetical protein